jgi:hypothetical protein
MRKRATYPKFKSIACAYFKLQQKHLKLSLISHSKTIEKPYTTFLEKVYLFTRKPTKLDLYFSDFSTIFNDFSMVQHGHPRSEN